MTHFAPFYGRFKEIGLLEVETVFVLHYQFGLDVLLGIEAKEEAFRSSVQDHRRILALKK